MTDAWDSISTPAPSAPAIDDRLVRTIIGEAAGEPDIGQQAVAATILNRAKLTGQDVGDVVLAPGQFEPWGNASTRQRILSVPKSSPTYQRAAANAAAAMQSDPTGGATHFFAPRAQAAMGRPAPEWSIGQRGQRFGSQLFYRLPYGQSAPSFDAISTPVPASAPAADRASWDAVSAPANDGGKPSPGGALQAVTDFLDHGRPQTLLGSGVALGVGKTIEGVGEAADTFGRSVITPALQGLGLDDLVREPGAAEAARQIAAPWLKGAQKAQPKNLPEQLIYGAGDMGISLAPAVLDPALLVGAFGAQGASGGADKARQVGQYGTARGDQAIAADALIQAGLSQLQLESLIGKPAAWAISKLPAKLQANAIMKAVTGLGVTAGSQAAIGAAMQGGENAAFKATIAPNQDLGQGVPEAAMQNAALGTIFHGAHMALGDANAANQNAAWDQVSAPTDVAQQAQPEPAPAAPTPVPTSDQVTINLPGGKTILAPRDNLPTGVVIDPATGEHFLNVNVFGDEPGSAVGPQVATPTAAPTDSLGPLTAPADAWDAVSQPVATPQQPPTAAKKGAPAADLDSQALDIIRRGKGVDLGQGPSLTQFIRSGGGLNDEGGELAAMDADFQRVGRNRITRKVGGVPLDQMAQRVYEAGYFPEVAPSSMDGGENLSVVTPQHLLDAISAELAGRPRYAAEADPAKADLAGHVADWEEILHHIGLDPRTSSNADILAARDELFGSPSFGDISEPAVSADGVPFEMRPVSGAKDLNASFLRDERLLPQSGPLRDRVAAGELSASRQSFGPGGSAEFVRTRNLLDHMPAGAAPTVYHETDLQSAKDLIPHLLAGQRRQSLYVSPNPDLALGQGGRGVTLEIDATHTNGFRPNSESNANLSAIGGGDAEYLIDKTTAPALRAITVSTKAQLDSLARVPGLASRFDFTNAQPVGKGFRIARIERAAPASEPVSLADGRAEQTLIPGVAPVTEAARQIAALKARMDARRGAAPMPAGGLFDEVAKAQTDLFAKPQDRADLLARGLDWDAVSAPADGGSRGKLGMVAPPDGQEMLHWDRPMSEQPAKVRAALEGFSPRPDETGGEFFRRLSDSGAWAAKDTAQELLRSAGADMARLRPDALTPELRSQYEAARDSADGPINGERVARAQLQKIGVRGIRYSDAASPEGTRGPRGDVAFADETGSVEKQGMRRQPMVDLSAYGDVLQAGGGRQGPKVDVSDRGVREAPKPGAVPVDVRDGKVVAYHGQTLAQMISRLRKSLGLTVRQGRMTLGRGALGEYDPATGVIRTRHGFDIDTLTHEAGHALEAKGLPHLKAAINAHKAEVAALHYPGANVKHTREEGFAEFVRWFLTNPDHAARVAPKFYPAFEEALAKDNPHLAAELKTMQAGYSAYMKTSSVNAVSSAIVTRTRNTLFKKLGEDVKELGVVHAADKWMNDIYTGRIDQLHPLKQAVDELLSTYAKNKHSRLSLPVAQDPYKLYRMVPGAHSAGHMDLLYGPRGYRSLERSSRGLAEIVTDAMGEHWTPERWTQWGAYLISRRAVHEYERAEDGKFNRPPDRFTKAAHEQVVRDLERLNPGRPEGPGQPRVASWKELGDQVHAFTSALLKRDVDAGFVSQDQFDALQAEHPFYVPFRRDRSDLTHRGDVRQDRTGKFANVIQAIEGSDRDYIHPIQSIIEDTYASAERTFRNEALRALLDLSGRVGPGGGAIVERLPAHEMQRINIDIRGALEKAAKAQGVHPRDMAPIIDAASEILDNELRVTAYSPRGISERGEPILHVWEHGEAVPIRLPDGEFGRRMFSAIVGMSDEARSTLLDVVDMLRTPAQVLRLGVTTTPRFFVKNLFVDQLLTWLTSDVNYKPFFSAARGLGDEMNQSEASRTYNDMGGIAGGANVSTLDKTKIDRDWKALDRRGYKFERFKSFSGLIHLSESSETATRIGVARLAMERAKAEGLDDYAAWKEGAFYARDLRDFDRHGAKMLAAVRTIPFLNANLQGLDKMRRVLGAEGNLKKLLIPALNDMRGIPLSAQDKRLVALSTKALLSVLAVSVLNLIRHAALSDDPVYQGISPYMKATHYVFRLPDGHYLFVPKPYEAAAPGNMLESAYDLAAKHDPNAWARMLQGLDATLLPNFMPTAVQVPLGLATNRNYLGAPIVPDHLKSVDPQLQYDAQTTAISKWLGRQIHWSPARIDYLMTSMLGSWGQALIDTSNSVEGSLRGTSPALRPEDTYLLKDWVHDVNRGTQTTSDFYNLMADDGSFTQANASFRLLVDGNKLPEAKQRFGAMAGPERAFVAASIIGGEVAKLHPLIRAKETATVLSDLRRDLRAGAIRGLDGAAISLTPEQRRDAYAALDAYRNATLRDAQVATGAPGYAEKQPVPLDVPIAALTQASPQLAAVVRGRLATKGVVDDDTASGLWRQIAPRLEGLSADQLMEVMAAKQYRGMAGVYRYLRLPPGQVPFQPAA